MSNRSCLVCHLNNKIISNNEQKFISIDLLAITSKMILTPKLRGKHSSNSQISLETPGKNRNSNKQAGVIKTL